MKKLTALPWPFSLRVAARRPGCRCDATGAAAHEQVGLAKHRPYIGGRVVAIAADASQRTCSISAASRRDLEEHRLRAGVDDISDGKLPLVAIRSARSRSASNTNVIYAGTRERHSQRFYTGRDL